MFRKNVASQFIHFQGVDSATGGIKSGVTWTIRRCIDGTFAAGGGTVTEDGTTGWYKYAMSQADTNGNNIGFNFTGTGAVPQTVNIVTTAADPTDGVRLGLTALPNAAAAAAGGLWILGANAAANTTLSGTAAAGATPATAALTLTGGAASTTSGGTAAQAVLATGGAGAASTNGAAEGVKFAGGGTNTVASNAHGLNVTGTSTGSGIGATSGAGATGDGITATAASTNGNGLAVTGVGTGNGIKAASASGAAISAVASTSGDGITATGAGTTKHGINATGGATTSDGIRATGGGAGHGFNLVAGSTGNALRATTTAGDGFSIAPTAGHGINLAANGTSKHGLLSTGGTAGTSDGASFVAGTGGVDFRANITGNLVGTVSTLTTYTGNTPQTGDSFVRLGAPAGASVSADIAAVKSDTVAIKTKTDFLPSATAGAAGGVFIAGSNAATTVNFTGNLSGSVGSVTGAVGSVTGSVGSVVGLTASNLDATITSRMASYTQPTGFLAATFPAGTVANTTNITAAAGVVLSATGADLVLVDTKTLPAALQYIAAAASGKVSGAGTGTEVFKGLDGATTRLTVTVDASGNRSAITYG